MIVKDAELKAKDDVIKARERFEEETKKRREDLLALVDLARGAHVLVAECSGDGAHPAPGHLTAPEAGRLAADAGVPAAGGGFSGITLAHNLASREAVDELLAQAGGLFAQPRVRMPEPIIRFDLTGAAAGQARWRFGAAPELDRKSGV